MVTFIKFSFSSWSAHLVFVSHWTLSSFCLLSLWISLLSIITRLKVSCSIATNGIHYWNMVRAYNGLPHHLQLNVYSVGVSTPLKGRACVWVWVIYRYVFFEVSVGGEIKVGQSFILFLHLRKLDKAKKGNLKIERRERSEALTGILHKMADGWKMKWLLFISSNFGF